MADPSKKNLQKQHSLSYVEKSLNLIPPPHQGPVTIYLGPQNKASDLSKADLEIANRLERLRRSSTELPSEEEMASRLAQLKGLPPDHYTKPRNVYKPPDTRTHTQQSDDLFKQIMEEVSLDAKAAKKCDDDLEERLGKLRGEEGESRPYSVSTVPLGFQLPSPVQLVPGDPSMGHGHHRDSHGIGMEHLNINEVDELMRAAEAENKAANQALERAKRDSKTSKAKSMRHKHKLKKEHKKQKKNRDKDKDTDLDKEKRRKKLFKRDKKVKGAPGEDSSSGEYFSDSDSDSSESEAKPKRTSSQTAAALKEKQEVDRIVQMYSAQPTSKAKVKSEDQESSEDDEEDSSTTDTDSEDYTSSDSEDSVPPKKHY